MTVTIGTQAQTYARGIENVVTIGADDCDAEAVYKIGVDLAAWLSPDLSKVDSRAAYGIVLNRLDWDGQEPRRFDIGTPEAARAIAKALEQAADRMEAVK